MCTHRLRENTGFHAPYSHETEGKGVPFSAVVLMHC
jgi:hypothetical protein